MTGFVEFAGAEEECIEYVARFAGSSGLSVSGVPGIALA